MSASTSSSEQDEGPIVVDPTSWRPVFKKEKRQERVVIPLGGTRRYRLDTSWDRTTVLFTRKGGDGVQAWRLNTGGEVVSGVNVSPLAFGNVRIHVELSRPARPLEKVLVNGDNTYLMLTYLR